MHKEIIVIGSGPAGIEAARAAATAGAHVTLVGDGPVGGRAGWHSLLPSKVWLTAAD
ncbi:MAG: FAD-dependent oxidoreductase, partial [Anaerolineales bacterium]|nr:FAD-dependent oxidoreductase [Anaerolineales bacterium]